MIQKLILACSILLSIPMQASSQVAQANSLYNNKQFKEALVSYENISHKDAVIWYNMGNAAYHLGDNKHARMYWRFAELSNPTEELLKNIHHNLQVLHRKYPDMSTDEHEYKNLIMQAHTMHNQTVGPFSWSLIIIQISALLLSSLLGILLVWCTARYRGRLITGVFLLLSLSIGLWTMHYRTVTDRVALVKKDNVMLYAGPDKNYHILGKVDGFTFVKAHKLYNEWFKIEPIGQDRLIGWIEPDTLVMI